MKPLQDVQDNDWKNNLFVVDNALHLLFCFPMVASKLILRKEKIKFKYYGCSRSTFLIKVSQNLVNFVRGRF